MVQNDSPHKPIFHGNDLEAAKKRAKEIKGVVIYSTAPDSATPREAKEWGYWSDEVGMLRSWEREEADYSE